jgi:predicted amidohydrolase YtcJ
MWSYRKTDLSLDSDEWFDVEATIANSNQRSRSGFFTMQVKRIEMHELLTSGEKTLYLVGVRYKADGSLGSTRASAAAHFADLPPEIRKLVRSYKPKGLA